MQIKKSVTSRLAYYLVLIILLSGISTCVTTLIMISNHSDAEMINVSGSLRMQSYRLLHEMQYQPELLQNGIQTYRASLQTSTLANLERFYVPDSVQSAYRTLLQSWAVMENYLLQRDSTLYRQNLESYVDQVDNFVSVLQVFSEQRVRFAIYINLSSLLLMVVLGAYLLSYSRKKVVEPLQRLVTASQQVQNSQFQHITLDIDSANELGELSRGFTQMAQQLQKLYLSLEEQVSQKTRSLTQINRTLSMLYYSSQQLTLQEVTRENLTTVLTLLQQNEKLLIVQLVPNGNDIFNVQVGQEASGAQWQTTRITINEQHLGSLNWQRGESYPDLRTIENIAQMLGRAIHSYQLLRQRQHLILMQERSIIARELHDSIAQSLAFLKIQTQLLRDAVAKGNTEARDRSMAELDTGVRECYADVRELLVHFRTRTQDEDIEAALRATLSKFEHQTGAATALSMAGHGLPLAQDVQIQVLHILQEALSNVRKHADAHRVELRVQRHPRWRFEVQDDGRGFDPDSVPPDSLHVGLGIMRERAQRIGAHLELVSRPGGGGTCVVLELPPTTREEPALPLSLVSSAAA